MNGETKRQEGKIMIQLDDLSKCINELGNTQDVLRDLLKPVLRPPEPSIKEEVEKEPKLDNNSPITDKLENLKKLVIFNNANIHNLIQRVEL